MQQGEGLHRHFGRHVDDILAELVCELLDGLSGIPPLWPDGR